MKDAILSSYQRGNKWGITPSLPHKRDLTESDIAYINTFNRVLRDMVPQLNEKGMCVPFNRMICKALRSKGVDVDIVYGDVLINEQPHWNITTKDLKKQLKTGISEDYQRIHCWLILPDHTFADCTIRNDIWGDPQVHFTDGFVNSHGETYRYSPLLMGHEFIERTNPELDFAQV